MRPSNLGVENMLEDEFTSEPRPKEDTDEFLPGSGPASILDEIRDVEFPVVRRGYDPHAVEAYVARVAQLVDDLEATRSPQYAVQRALENVGEETASILRQAQETARQMTSRSKAQAHERLQDAEQESTRLRLEAEAHVRRIEGDAERIWAERQRLIEDTRTLAEAVLRAADDAHERIPERDGPAASAAATDDEQDAWSTNAVADGPAATAEPFDQNGSQVGVPPFQTR
jgi:DivIVA domain-containing protein